MQGAMPELFNPQAADASVAGVLAPASDTLPQILRHWRGTRPLLVSSGGTSSRCAASGHWTLDLRPAFQGLSLIEAGSAVRIGAGCRMGEVLQALAQQQRTITAGLSGLPGMGYLLTGGVGPLSREHGLAIDHLRSIRGVWGNGTPFLLEPSAAPEWRALCGAAPFLAVVTEVTLACVPLSPLWMDQRLGTPDQLGDWICEAEGWSERESLQWLWCGDQIRFLRISRDLVPDAICIGGLHQLPPLGSPPPVDQRLHGEVVGLLGPAAAERWRALLPELKLLMRRRPHPSCSLACQQLGGATARAPRSMSSFIHRDAVWKPWITTVWPHGDAAGRRAALAWMLQVWDVLESVCPGIHLAQLHDHLPFHQRELNGAFGSWLEGLRSLKRHLDPAGNLPPL